MSHFSVGIIIPKDKVDIKSFNFDWIKNDIRDYVDMVMEPFNENAPLDSDYVAIHEVTEEYIQMYLKANTVAIQNEKDKSIIGIEEEAAARDLVTEIVVNSYREYEQYIERCVTTPIFMYENSPVTLTVLKEGYCPIWVPACLHKSLYDYMQVEAVEDYVPVLLYDVNACTEGYPSRIFIECDSLVNASLFAKWDKTPSLSDFHDFDVYDVYNDYGFYDYYTINTRWCIPTIIGEDSPVTKIKNINLEHQMPEEEPYHTFALIDKERQWFQPGRMGWFGASDETEQSKEEYFRTFQEKIRQADLDDLFVLVDCHI